MKPRIKIENFGPLKDIEIEINNLIILTGEQASGKSTLAKCIYFFKSIPDEILNALINNRKKNISGFSIDLIDKFKKIWISQYYSNQTYIKYDYLNNKTIEIQFVNGEPVLIFSDELTKSLHKLLNEIDFSNFETQLKLNYEELDSFITSRLAEIFEVEHECVYIPAGRSTLLKINQKDNEESNYTNDYFLNLFTQRIKANKEYLSGEIIENDFSRNANNKLQKIIKSVLSFDKESVYLKVFGNEVELPLSHLSSGQEEVIWLSSILKQYMIELKSRFLVIEEPETNLYPKAQKEIVEIIALFINANKTKHQVVITTHSPYILAVMNNLFLAQSKNKSEIIRDVISEKLWLDIWGTSAYLLKNGEAHNCVDIEYNSINIESVDAVAEEINNLFYKVVEVD